MTAIPVFRKAPCESCQAPVIWAVTINGHRMPVDAEPSPEKGNLRLEYRDDQPLVPVVHVVNAHIEPDRSILRTSHFVTCPDASRWRRERRPR